MLQVIFVYFGLWLAGFDSLFIGFILRAYQQLNLLAMRISKIPEMVNKNLIKFPDKSKLNIEKEIFKNIVKQHQLIFE